MTANTVKVALAGNPNVGKSTVFNFLTGLHQHTGNWPGKTVLSAFGNYEYGEKSYTLVDLPGTYSLNARSPEEEAARDYICFEEPDITVVVADATCLERNMNLLFQTLELTERVILCINLMDEAKKKKMHIDCEKLSEKLNIPIVAISAGKKKNLEELKKTIYDFDEIKKSKGDSKVLNYGGVIETAANIVAKNLDSVTDTRLRRWLALRILEENESALKNFTLKNEVDFSSEKLKNAAAKAVHLLECSGIERSALHEKLMENIFENAKKLCDECVFCKKERCFERDFRVDKVLTSKRYGIPLMLLMLTVLLWITISGANYPSKILSNLLFSVEDELYDVVLSVFPAWTAELLVYGVYRTLSWIVSVMLPPMAIFFPLFTFLEDLGYLPRVAFNLDGFFEKSHACGKQALTMCMGLGCNAAGVVGCRIIDSPRERLIAILTNSLVPCNGRFPLLITLGTMLFVGISVNSKLQSALSALIVALFIALGVLLTFFVSKILSATLLKGEASSFTLELPPYRRPQAGKILVRSIIDRTLFVLGRAAAVAAPAGAIIWLMANLHIDGVSLLEHCAAFLDPLGRLAGMDGYILTAFILGFPANEIVIPLIVMAYMSNGYIAECDSIAKLFTILSQNGWTWVTAVCVMLFSLVHFPCATTIMTIKKETGSVKWAVLSFVIPTVLGLALCIAVASAARAIGFFCSL